MQCEPKGLCDYVVCNVCRFTFTGNSASTMPVQSNGSNFVASSASTQYGWASQAVWNRIPAEERWLENRRVLETLAEPLLQRAKTVEELVRTPETGIMAKQRAKNASTDKMFNAWLAQLRVACGVHKEELSSSALLAQTYDFKDANPTDTRKKWYKKLTTIQ